MSDETGPESKRPSGLIGAPRPPDIEALPDLPSAEAPVPPSAFQRGNVEPPLVQRPSLEPQRLSMSMLDPDALAPLFFAGLFTASFIGIGYVLAAFLSDFVLAFILVGLSRRTYERLRLRLGGRSILASLLATLAIAFGIIGPMSTLVYVIGLDATAAMSDLPHLISTSGDKIAEKLASLLGDFGVRASKAAMMGWLTETLSSIQQVVFDWGAVVLTDAVAGAVHLLIILVMVFYILIDGNKLKSFVFDLSPLPDHEDAALIETFIKVSRGVVIGNGLASAIQGVLGGMAMALVGLPSPVLWGGVMAFFAFLPLLGISTVTIPAAIYLYLMGRPAAALGFFGFCAVQGFVVENIIKTRLMGSAMRMHDLMVFLSILGGLSAFGVIGFVYGPLLAMLFMTLSDMYQKHYRPRFMAQLGMRR
jgi:predicted PurR-regulated permease PerM